MEDLLAAEVPTDSQWAYLDHARETQIAPTIGIPDERPEDPEVRELTKQLLRAGKGWGRAAELIERCEATELPASITTFLQGIYDHFPRPGVPDPLDGSEAVAEGAEPSVAEPIEASEEPSATEPQ